MKAYLLFENRDFDWEKDINQEMLTCFNDLELETVFQIMSGENRQIYENVRKVMAQMLTDPDDIRFRQDILKDCIKNPWIFDKVSSILKEIEAHQENLTRHYGILKDYPSSVLSISRSMIEIFIKKLRELKEIFSTYYLSFDSAGFRRLISQLDIEMTETFFSEVQDHLEKCNFEQGIYVTTSLGEGLKADSYTIGSERIKKFNWTDRFFNRKKDNNAIRIKDKNDNSARNLSDLRERILTPLANTLMQSVEHLSNFFRTFQYELSFYQGCYNLYQFLTESRKDITYPTFDDLQILEFEGLYDVSLAIVKDLVVGNTCTIDDKQIVFITGANQGGKTTFLRSFGQAVLMAQCGMFVGATHYKTEIYNQLFTYFRKDEEEYEDSGKLDEELRRMDEVISKISTHSCLLMNEPFSSTSEREGSEIGFNIIKALAENDVMIFCVTHFYALTYGFAGEDEVLFLRAQRMEDGQRTFKLVQQEPQKTGYGLDLYRKIFRA